MKRSFALLAALGLVLALAGRSHASPINVGDPKWYEFGFGGTGFTATDGTGTTPSEAGNSQFAPTPPWTFTSTTPVAVTLTDAFLRGDTFSLFDNNVLIGSTPIVPVVGQGPSPTDPAVTSLDPLYSHGVFSLGAGSHSLTIRVDTSITPIVGGAGFFRADAIPEPTSIALFGLGTVGLAASRLLRRKPVAA
jgi:hypothetical protein